MNHLPSTHSSDDDHGSRSYSWSIANKGTGTYHCADLSCPVILCLPVLSGGIIRHLTVLSIAVVSSHCFPRWGWLAPLLSVSELLWVSSSLDPIFVAIVGVIGEHVRQCFLVVLLAFLWWLAVLHIMANTYEHWAISLWGITSQVPRSSKSQFIIVLLWRCLISYKCGIIFTRRYTLRIFSPIL